MEAWQSREPELASVLQGRLCDACHGLIVVEDQQVSRGDVHHHLVVRVLEGGEYSFFVEVHGIYSSVETCELLAFRLDAAFGDPGMADVLSLEHVLTVLIRKLLRNDAADHDVGILFVQWL